MNNINEEPTTIESIGPFACLPCKIEEANLSHELSIHLVNSPALTGTNASVGQAPPSEKPTFETVTGQIAPIVSLLGAIFIFYKYGADRKEARSQKKIERLEEHLNTFFGPLKELREESKLLYEMFAIDLKDQEKKQGRHFRTIRYLRQNDLNTLSEYDIEILDSIIRISKKNIEFIEENSGAIENTALSTLLGKLCAHFRVMEIAAKGKLLGAPESMENIVFPLETDGAIDNEVKKIHYKLDKLRNNLTIKERLKKVYYRHMIDQTIQFYDNNADAYYRETNHVDMEDSYDRFRKLIGNGGRILDAGCGVGRDTRYFISKGYKVQSFDLSSRMCEITRKYPYSFCTQMSFMDVDYYEEFDAIWANASLLHVPESDMPEAIARLARSLKVGGYLFASFKTDKNFSSKDTRKFYFHTKDDLEKSIRLSKFDLVFVDRWSSFKGDNPSNEEFHSYIWQRKS
ncbi:class I SAM-dependent methyltransferase [Vibrio sp. 1CM8B]|uniref:class I SAM-dependent methyltransferase n=1 Tax=Vibrio sp. 1CM8B TaxID=2929167 RepID=UPI0020BE3A9C|nr:class I SAM-dependent methyltransferase [Vibrio sp. 1CM8B]MCK8085763.1 class I SAM-dependent methyltransferase [Vibrio sp. 1CM8B]